MNNENIIQYYKDCESHYRIHWDLDKNRAMNYGFWDDETRDLPEALMNLNKVMAQAAKIKNMDAVLDAGCGVGGSAIYLAKQIGCRVTGITICDNQIESAMKNVQEENCQEFIKIEKKDYRDSGYNDNSFDVVWAIESVCHAPQKGEFLSEAYRLLKKGGRLIVADFFRQENFNTLKDRKLVNKMAKGWVITDFASPESFTREAESAGFKDIQFKDITANVLPSARLVYRAFKRGIAPTLFYRLKGAVSQLAMNNVWSAYYQYHAFRKNLCSYGIVSAIK